MYAPLPAGALQYVEDAFALGECYRGRVKNDAIGRNDSLFRFFHLVHVVKDRFDRLLKLVQQKASEASARFTGSVQKVLVEEVNEHDDSMVTGRMSNNLLVHFKGTPDLIGQIVNVHLEECKGFYYIGKLSE